MNNFQRLLIRFAIPTVAVFVLSAACTESDSAIVEKENSTFDDGTTIALSGIGLFDSVSGQAAIDVTVSGSSSTVELLVDDVVVATDDSAPFTLIWDSTSLEDGVVMMSARSDVATTNPIPVVVMNTGTMVELFKPEYFEMTIAEDWSFNPDDEGEGRDMAINWMTTETKNRAIAATWFESSAGDDEQKKEWELDLSVGTGSCPHGGEVFDAKTKKTNSFVWFYTDLKPFEKGVEHFIHVRAIDAETHRGETLQAYMRVFVF